MHGHKAFLDNNIKFYSRLLSIKNGITSGGVGGGESMMNPNFWTIYEIQSNPISFLKFVRKYKHTGNNCS